MRRISREEASFVSGLPVTRPERTTFDLVADNEDMSLITNALRDALRNSVGFDMAKLCDMLVAKYGDNRANRVLDKLEAADGRAIGSG